MAEVSPVRQPWSTWVAHQSSSSLSISSRSVIAATDLGVGEDPVDSVDDAGK
jgi:hypothetical protein